MVLVERLDPLCVVALDANGLKGVARVVLPGRHPWRLIVGRQQDKRAEDCRHGEKRKVFSFVGPWVLLRLAADEVKEGLAPVQTRVVKDPFEQSAKDLPDATAWRDFEHAHHVAPVDREITP